MSVEHRQLRFANNTESLPSLPGEHQALEVLSLAGECQDTIRTACMRSPRWLSLPTAPPGEAMIPARPAHVRPRSLPGSKKPRYKGDSLVPVE